MRRIGDLRGFTRSLAIALLLAGCAKSPAPSPTQAQPQVQAQPQSALRVTALDAQTLGTLREHFNAASEKTRLLALLSPS